MSEKKDLILHTIIQFVLCMVFVLILVFVKDNEMLSVTITLIIGHFLGFLLFLHLYLKRCKK
jgi:hypothetical protein